MTTVLARRVSAPAEMVRGPTAALLAAALVLTAPVLTGVAAGAAQEVPRSREQITLSFASVVGAAAPAVVNVFTLKERHPGAANRFLSDPFFRLFFEDFGGDRLPRQAPENSLGSGVVATSKAAIAERPLPWRIEVERAGRRLAVVIGG
jgi:S1-C subfamily serine protease